MVANLIDLSDLVLFTSPGCISAPRLPSGALLRPQFRVNNNIEIKMVMIMITRKGQYPRKRAAVNVMGMLVVIGYGSI